METGAFFEGNCRHSDDPISQSSNSAARTSGTAPRPAAPAAPSLGDGPRATPRPTAGNDSPVVVNDGGVVVKRPAAQ